MKQTLKIIRKCLITTVTSMLYFTHGPFCHDSHNSHSQGSELGKASDDISLTALSLSVVCENNKKETIYLRVRGVVKKFILKRHLKTINRKQKCIVMVRFVNLTQTKVTWAEGSSMKELIPSYWPESMSVRPFSHSYQHILALSSCLGFPQ